MNLRLFAIPVLFVSFLYAFPVIAHYGSIWDAREHPKADVAVTLKGGDRVRGALSREWNGDYVLDDAERRTAYVFSRDGFLMMSVPRPSEQEQDEFLRKHWRMWVPPMLFTAAVLVMVLGLAVPWKQDKFSTERER